MVLFERWIKLVDKGLFACFVGQQTTSLTDPWQISSHFLLPIFSTYQNLHPSRLTCLELMLDIMRCHHPKFFRKSHQTVNVNQTRNCRLPQWCICQSFHAINFPACSSGVLQRNDQPCCSHQAKQMRGRGEGTEKKDRLFFSPPPLLSPLPDENNMAAKVLKVRMLKYACKADYKLLRTVFTIAVVILTGVSIFLWSHKDNSA